MDDTDHESDRRSKRKKFDKGGRFEALKKLKQLKDKGTKNKYEVNEIDNVYETVDEDEYTKRVVERQNDDWIVNEGAHGYVEDGRDIFDDDLDTESIAAAQKEQKRGKKRKKGVSDNAPKGNIQYMLSNVQSKKKEDVKLADDDLSDLISELNESDEPSKKSAVIQQQNSSVLSEKIAAKSYMSTFSSPRAHLKIQKVHNKSLKVNRNIKESPKIEEERSVPKETIAKGTDGDTNETKHDEHSDLQQIELVQEEEKGNNVEEDLLADDDYDLSQIVINESDTLTDSTTNNTEKQIHDEKLLAQLESGWETMLDKFEATEFEDTLQENTPPAENNDNKDEFLFYWYDAYENKAVRPGVVLLFGKTYCAKEKSYVSCCVAVKNIDRQIYLLPRLQNLKTKEPVTIMDVYNEFNDNFATKMRMDTFKSRKVKKKYAFDDNVPMEAEYLEIHYSTKYPALAEDTSGNTFSRVFGTSSNFLELLLLDRKIKGPCWLTISNAEVSKSPLSWCQIEMDCFKLSSVSILNDTRKITPPPLTVVSINLKNIVNSKLKSNEIILVSCLVHKLFYVDKEPPNPPFQQHFCIIRPLPNQPLPSDFYQSLQSYKGTKVQKIETESALFNYLIMQLTRIDPDLIVGHDLHGNLLNLLAERLLQKSIKDISKLGRVRKQYSKGNLEELRRSLFCGRLVCDLKISLKELIKARSYDLDTLCSTVLKLEPGQRVDLDPEDIPRVYENSSDILKLISCTMQDTAYILKMMYEMNVIPLALQITTIAGNVLSRTLMGGRSERNEFLLSHAFYEKGYIPPGKYSKENKEVAKKKRQADYSGGLVLEPKVGYYDKMILLMDFNSLYPSIIQEYNVCFTTQNLLGSSEKTAPPGILPTEIRKLVESRREVKKLMNAPDVTKELKLQYNIRQMALKLTANSMYGCLGFPNSRFYAKNLAEYVTQKGREILTNTRDLVQNMQYDVIYGDTDSIMINTKEKDYEAVMKVGHKIKYEINKLYKQVELDIDGVFRYLLLLKKKKYAAVTLTKSFNGELITNHEYKGLDFVRRDWCSLTGEAGKCILNCLLSDMGHDEKLQTIKEHLEKLREDFDNNLIPFPLLVITKQLNKDPQKYIEPQQYPHVKVALRYNAKNSGKMLRGGDTVSYVICDDGSSSVATQRAYHVEEFKKSNMKLDVHYYLAHQIHPVITRLLDPIQGIDAYEIAMCLGIKDDFKKPLPEILTENNNLNAPEERFRGAEPFQFKCRSCKEINIVDHVKNPPFLTKCSNVKCNATPINYIKSIQNDLTLLVRRLIKKLYKTKYICEDPCCTYETLRIPSPLIQGIPNCESCKENKAFKKYSSRDLNVQIRFFRYIFDPDNYKNVAFDEQTLIAFNSLTKYIVNLNNTSAYINVSLGGIMGIIYGDEGDTSLASSTTGNDVVDEGELEDLEM